MNYGQGLFLADRPCPLIIAFTVLYGRFGAQGLRIEIRPCPKVCQTLPVQLANMLQGLQELCRIIDGAYFCIRNRSGPGTSMEKKETERLVFFEGHYHIAIQ